MRTRLNRTGPPLPPPVPDYSFVGLAAVRSNMSRVASALPWTAARYVSLPVCYLYPRRSPVPHRTKVNIYQGRFFLIPNAARLFTTISRCLWSQIQHPEKPFRCLSALANESMGVSHEGRGRPASFVSKASVSSLIFDVFGRVGGDHPSWL